MSKLLLNNKFCAFLIVITNAILISGLVIAVKYLGEKKAVVLYYVIYLILLGGNAVIRLAIKSTSQKLASYYKVIMTILCLLYPVLPLVFQWTLGENSE